MMNFVRSLFPLVFLSALSAPAFSAPDGQEGKKKPPGSELTRLEETDLGKALIRGASIADFRKEYEKLTKLPPPSALAVLTAKDGKRNSALHYMVQVKEEDREAFAGEALRYSLDLMNYMDHYDIFDDWNKEGLTPRDLARRVGNSTAAEYLRLVENMAKNHRENRLRSGSDETKSTINQTEAEQARQTALFKKGVLISLVLLNGSFFTVSGIALGHPEVFLGFGLPQLIIGGWGCYDVFKESKNGKKPTGSPPS